MGEDWYESKKRRLRELYWEQNDGNPYLPNGFLVYPHEIYDFFLSFINHPGRVIDLGCGNGLLLRHLVKNSGYGLIPYGVDFIEESIEQAKREILPEFADNFTVANVRDYVREIPDGYFDFIFFDPYNVHPEDLPETVSHLIRVCRAGGRIIFYTYHDVLESLNLEWVGDFLPEEVRGKLERFNHLEVSVGVFEKRGKAKSLTPLSQSLSSPEPRATRRRSPSPRRK
ncbi:bifunctional 2-polyprenyl-6-hydroxyphenol methylase/3-demethylubiquinol 3-O-methyltransferase UbiG [Thermococcus sp. AM4]|uniref:class I SAM-dependent methyltransferase n=1 Tax=Thermococcus sp. (strain AM4) TaxID=246969 RepID=UPI000A04AB97|nr:class I SAM-dependent methyltransferase [Thermococcus sp. AM4]